ncbi:putative metallocarboxypeptidase ecm14 [Cryomyces antarcticus]
MPRLSSLWLLAVALTPLLPVSAVPPNTYPLQGLPNQPQAAKVGDGRTWLCRPWSWRIADRIKQRVCGQIEEEVLRDIVSNDTAKSYPSGKLLAKYGGDMVLRFNVSTEYEAKMLADAADTLYLDVWEYNEDWVDIHMAKGVVPSLMGLLPSSLQHAHAPLMQEHELAQAIANTYPSPTTSTSSRALEPDRAHSFSPSLRKATTSETNMFFQDYQPLSVIEPWFRLLASLYPTHVRLVNIGITYEGRDIPAVRVGVHPTSNDSPSEKRKSIIISGGSHAREWVSTSTVNYIAYNLIKDYGQVASMTHLLEDFDWIFIPTLNPDGYVYTWKTDRLWRKNRQATSLRFCRGIDLDRSYSFQWNGESTAGNPCSESFAGEAPFEGSEAKAFADWARNETENNNVEIVGFLNLHSYSQQVLYPYSYSCAVEPPSLENLEELASGLSKAIRLAHGHVYKVLSACEGNVALKEKNSGSKVVLPRMETGGGSALDYFYHELKVRYAYQIKLRDTGSYGFLLPKENIVPTGKEILDAITYFGRYLTEEYSLRSKEQDKEVEAESKAQEVNEQQRPVPRRLNMQGALPSANGEEERDETGDLQDIQWELKRRRRR